MDRKEKKRFLSQLEKQFGFNGKLDYSFFVSGKDKVYAVNKDIGGLPLGDLRVNMLGIYFAEIGSDEVRLSIEGSQIIGPHAAKNVVEVPNEDAIKWIKGQDICPRSPLGSDVQGFVIIKSGKDYLGTGKLKNGTILNYVPKIRRLNVAD